MPADSFFERIIRHAIHLIYKLNNNERKKKTESAQIIQSEIIHRYPIEKEIFFKFDSLFSLMHGFLVLELVVMKVPLT